jgi:acetyltransferase
MTRPTVRMVAPTEIEELLPALVELLRESVNAGASLGFLPRLTPDEGRRYWLSLRADLRGGSRLLFAAYGSDRLLGSGQLVLPPWPNARHRAEVQKLLVAAAERRHGIGRRLVHAMHDSAWQRGRSLLLLNARRGDPAETFYKRLGYREAGVIPGYTVGAAGEAYDNVAMYRLLRAEGHAGAGSRDDQS